MNSTLPINKFNIIITIERYLYRISIPLGINYGAQIIKTGDHLKNYGGLNNCNQIIYNGSLSFTLFILKFNDIVY